MFFKKKLACALHASPHFQLLCHIFFFFYSKHGILFGKLVLGPLHRLEDVRLANFYHFHVLPYMPTFQ